jgi:LacI family transcriptional regulator
MATTDACTGQLITPVSGAGLDAASAPRPYFHPVRTVSGTVLTDVAPADHIHHLGLSIAFSDLNGTNFWGGSTYTPDRGPVVLPNHGRQLAESRPGSDGAGGAGGASGAGGPAGEPGARGTVLWVSEEGVVLARERRTVRAFTHPAPGTWSLSLDSVMVPAGGIPALEVSSSAVKGRTGAGYGGIFWRFPADCSDTTLLCADGAGEDAAHGSRSPWLAISTVTGGAPATVVLAQGIPARPWFIRAGEYLGAGPAVAWSRKAVADAAHPLHQVLHAVIHDGRVTSPDQALRLLEHHPAANTTKHPDRTP